MSDFLRIELATLDGRTLEVVASPDNRVSVLKQRIAGLWSLPALCQRLASSDVVLDDSERLGAYCIQDDGQEKVLSLCVLIDDAQMYAGLRSGNPSTRREAIEAVAMMKCGEDEAIVLLGAHLADSIIKVRETALAALTHMGEKGDVRLIREACAHFRHEDQDVREKALRLFAQVTYKGCDAAKEEILACLTKWPNAWQTHWSVVQAISKVFEKGDEVAVFQTMECVTHPMVEVQTKALQQICEVANAGDPSVVETLRTCLHNHKKPLVRRLAVDALVVLCDPNDDATISDVKRLGDEKYEVRVRKSVMVFVARFAKPGDRAIIKMLAARVADKSDVIREGAVKALGYVVQDGEDEATITTLSSYLEHWDKGVRRRAVDALSLPIWQGVQCGIRIVRQLLAHDHDWVRWGAVACLKSMYSHGDEEGIELLRSCLSDHSAVVVQEALRGLCHLANEGDTRILEAAVHCLNHSDSWVREASAEIMATVSAERNLNHARALVRALDSELGSSVLQAVLKAIAKVAPLGDDVSVTTTVSLLTHIDDAVRTSAADTLVHITSATGYEHEVSRMFAFLKDRLAREMDIVQVVVGILVGFIESGNAQAHQDLRSLVDSGESLPSVKDDISNALARIILINACD
eukprot:TRINITY_DN9320_c0_g1_i1.p1 TRINITY_DN9320_c0_g1~~TRINITY_DN9320_c0_g1_i1.p1  ORF type:complete len:636 (-),score=85.00 TRINITY_DN9320_c0_g1_i1:132-2039(-)